MRTLGFRTHVLLAVAAAVGVIAALARPWYAPAPPPEAGLDALAGYERWITMPEGTPGWDALGVWGTAIAGLAALTAVAAVGCLVPSLQGVARELLRYAALGCLAIVAWKLFDSPGANAALELRFGALVATGAALVAFTSGSAVASTPLRRRQPARAAFAAPAPPPGA